MWATEAGLEELVVFLTPYSPFSPVRTMVQDNKDGTYYISYTPREPGIYTVLVCVKEQHVQVRKTLASLSSFCPCLWLLSS